MPDVKVRHPVIELTRARMLAFIREPEIVFWVFAFPLLMTLALGIAFREGGPSKVPVGVISGAGSERLVDRLAADPSIDVRVISPEEVDLKLRDGEVQLVVIPSEPPTYRYDPSRVESREARGLTDAALQRGEGRQDLWQARDEHIVTPGSRYIDWLVPGLLGMGIMGSGLWGIGFGIVDARLKKLLKRYAATPMRRSHYLVALLLSRLSFLGIEMFVVLGFARLVFGVPMAGSVFLLIGVCVMGSLAFAALGLLIASRAKTIEAASGLINLATVPMYIFSGVFFSPEHFPRIAQAFIGLLPLTALNEALRAVMLDGAGVFPVAPRIAVLVVWTIGSFALALRLFRWQ